MSRKKIFYIIFFAVLVFGFFGALAITIPGFVKPSIPPIGVVQPFAFTSQEGKVITEKDLSGKVSAVNFFFITCKSVCPRMNNNLKPLYEAFKNEPDFLIVSHTSEPHRDTVAALKHYSDSLQVDPSRWLFLTGRKDSLYNMARHSYKIDDPKNFVQRIEDDFLHTQFVALVNRKGEVIRIYDGLKSSEMGDMKKDIEKLLKE